MATGPLRPLAIHQDNIPAIFGLGMFLGNRMQGVVAEHLVKLVGGVGGVIVFKMDLRD